MTSPRLLRHCRASVIALAAAVVAASCGAGTTPVAEITPIVDTACATAETELASLDGQDPTYETAGTAAAHLFEIFKAMPDAETDLGRPGPIVGDHVQSLRLDLSTIQSATRRGDPDFDSEETETDVRQSFADLNNGAAEFAVEPCLTTAILEDVLLPHVAMVAAAVDANAPTGDFDVDIAAVCDRFRQREIQLWLNDDPTGFADQLLITRLRGLARDLVFDLELLDPPSDRKAEVDQLIATADRFDGALSTAQSAQFTSQENLDAAIDNVDLIQAQLVERISEIHPGC